MSKNVSATRKVDLRKAKFTEKQVTKIWKEEPAASNPYIADKASCYGYDLLQLMEKCSFVDVLYLIFQGKLPSQDQAKLLESLMIGFINPGPRHPATRAAMNAGIGKTDLPHILPISLNVLGGIHLGANEVEAAMRFIRKNIKKHPDEVVDGLFITEKPPTEGDWHIAPGFGNRFGSIDKLADNIALHLNQLPAAGTALKWGAEFAKKLGEFNMGWLSTGVVAATLADLKFQPKTGIGLFQLISAPGLFAHGQELSNKPFSAMPFPKDEDYIID